MQMTNQELKRLRRIDLTKPKKINISHEKISADVEEYLKHKKINYIPRGVSGCGGQKRIITGMGVRAVHIETGEVLEFESIRSVEKQGFSPSQIHKIMKKDGIYKDYKWSRSN